LTKRGLFLCFSAAEHAEEAEKKLSTIHIVFSVFFESKINLCDLCVLRGECPFILRRGEAKKMDRAFPQRMSRVRRVEDAPSEEI